MSSCGNGLWQYVYLKSRWNDSKVAILQVVASAGLSIACKHDF
jgi:hypothetical protein